MSEGVKDYEHVADVICNRCHDYPAKHDICPSRETLERLEYAVLGTAGTVGTSLSICADQCHPEYEGDPYEKCTILQWRPYPSGNGVSCYDYMTVPNTLF